MSQPVHPMVVMLADTSVPLSHRAAMLHELTGNITPETEPLIKGFFDLYSNRSSEAQHAEKTRKLDAMLKEIQEGPSRLATVVEDTTPNAAGVCQALVALDDGTWLYSVVPDSKLAGTLHLGDRVVVDGKGRVVFHRTNGALNIGEEARLERKVDERRIEVTVQGDSQVVVLAPAKLMDQITAGSVPPGSAIVVNLPQRMAVEAIPPHDGLEHYRFLYKGPVPEVWPDRHIGAPPKVIREVAEHIFQEMTNPELRRRYGVRRCKMKLLCGASGSGKTLAIHAIHRQTYETMSQVTGEPIEKLPRRVFHLRSSQILNKWLGASDRNADRWFDEIEKLAGEKFTTSDGRQIQLPVLVIIEEADGIGRARGQEAIYDRLLTIFLQRLDPNSPGLRDKLVVFLATTNEAHIVDPAFLRRVGGSIETFGRLSRVAFRAVLQKLTQGLPVASNNGCPQDELRGRLTNEITAWLFGPNAEPGVVELTFAGSTTPVIKYRRDFLTGALVDRAVQKAADEACLAEGKSGTAGGITSELLKRALDEQVRGTVSQLREQTVGHYTDLPDGVRVATLRRIPQPAYLSVEFQRT